MRGCAFAPVNHVSLQRAIAPVTAGGSACRLLLAMTLPERTGGRPAGCIHEGIIRGLCRGLLQQ